MNNFVLGINRISSIINTCTFIISIMILFDIDIRNMFVSLSIAAAAIAVLSKDYITSMANGLIIMFSDRLSLGDKIIIGEFSGKIRDITLINIIIENQEGDVIVIPNSVVSSSIVLNRSKKDIRQVIAEFELGLDRISSVDEVEKALKSSLTPFLTNIRENSFSLQVVSMKQDLINCKAQLALTGHNKAVEHQIHRTIQDAIIALATRPGSHLPKG
ncbi:mechanosensitive ion channel [Pedobacter riviphilus]|uniref:Mechanosensitive ion channel n=1 Tax=Pedobacter riviphilus TaxID=2766984 RepID=A0ABX6TML5_9SPHI|nr:MULTISPECIES: mechanosensitive ion channel domain-containing protein [Pedobacter]NII83224.1 small-conductance mechanosensitive channel [Pedobacter sp. SG908]QNR86812.1 mechanosensitive ion channel [Pedobacter riviphilus]